MDASALNQYSLKQIDKEKYFALLIGQYGSRAYPNKEIQEDSLRELFMLAETAGIDKMHNLFFKIKNPDAGLFLTKGIVEKIQQEIIQSNFNIIIIDTNLKPGQLRGLEEIFKQRVIGRSELILDIFAMRAITKSAILQVELAQLTYILPRLKGLGGVLSRLGGGIGTRGPGETMLETDKRHIRKKILRLKKDLEKISRQRNTQRKNRNIFSFSLVGYTNAGKSSLLNVFTASHKKVFAEDKLFATLDSFSRKVYLGNYEYKPVNIIISDTVGFIKNIPDNLSEAFSSTLEEIKFTDGIIIVLDASNVYYEQELKVVQEELEKLSVADKPVFLYFNKDDLVFSEEKKRISEQYKNAIWGNTLSKEGCFDLKNVLYEYVVKKNF